jgi:GTPase involved in cell partitioning and DNA repair
MSITEREYGALEQELKQIQHKIRNIQTTISLSGISSMTKEDVDEFKKSLVSSFHQSDSIEDVEKKLVSLTDEVTRMKIKIYTAFSVIGVLFTVVLWLVDLAFKFTESINYVTQPNVHTFF